MLAFEVALLTGRYVATAVDNRAEPEWPPHPARLFSALVSTHFEALEQTLEERAVLEWLERQGSPEITAPESTARDAVTVYVPVNDTSVVSPCDDELEAVRQALIETDEARPKGGKALAAAEKKHAKAETRFVEATQKAIAVVAPGKEGKEAPGKAAALIPDRRMRQPRSFPSVTALEMSVKDPCVVFSWPKAEPSSEQLAALDGLAARMVRLGHSSSFVSVRRRDDSPQPTWIPAAADRRGGGGSQILRVVTAGQLAALCADFDVQGDEPGRVMPATFQRYERPEGTSPSPPAQSCFSDDWTILRRLDGPRLPSVRAVDLARMVRKALMSAHGPGAPEILSGHLPSGEASVRPHLAYVPLPYVGAKYADGTIMGVALVFPSGATREERLAVHRAVDTWEQRARREDAYTPRLPVHLGKTGVLGLARLEEEPLQSTLRALTWCGQATRWASATPVALDRNPGDLHSRDPEKSSAAYAEAELTIALACERIDLPRPARVTVVPAAPLAGAAKARQFPPYLAGQPPMQRVLVHATLEFESPVVGPVLLGAGRYFGLGLFRPVIAHG